MKKKIFFNVFFILTLISANAQIQDVSLKSVLEKSIEHSQKLKIREVEIEQYRHDRRSALETYLPTLTLEGTYTYLNEDIVLPEDMTTLLTATQALLIKEKAGIPFNTPLSPQIMQALAAQGVTIKEIPPIQEQNILKANVSSQMVLFSGLKVPYAMKATNEMMKMNSCLNEQEKNTIAKDVVTTYEKMGIIIVSEEALMTTEKYLNEQERFVNKAVAGGLATDLDLQRINLAKEQLLAKKIELQSSKKLLCARLSQLSGIPSEDLMNIKPDLKLTLLPDSLRDVSQRSDMQALDHALTASKLNQKIQYTEYMPKVFAFGKKELLTDDLSAFDPEWYVGVGVRWNIFDRFAAHHSAQKAKLNTLILEEKKQESLDLLNLGRQKAEFNLERADQLVAVAEKEVALAEKSYNLSLKEYQNGMISAKTHLESINDLEKAKLNQIQALYDRRAAVYELMDMSGSLYEFVK
jgi:outer membrane protein TolC